MTEWLSYRPSDFLMFAPRTYWRLFELHNGAWWPAQPLAVLAGLCWMGWLLRSGSPALRAFRVGALGLAAASSFVAVTFLLDRYAAVNWAASGFAVGFVTQALGLAALATRVDWGATSPGPRRRIGLTICAWALLGHPLLVVAFDRPWTQAEVFGMAPDPTAIATLGFLLCAHAQRRLTRWLLRSLWTLATAWCVISSATLWTMGSAQAWVLMGVTLAALAAAWLKPYGSAGESANPRRPT